MLGRVGRLRRDSSPSPPYCAQECLTHGSGIMYVSLPLRQRICFCTLFEGRPVRSPRVRDCPRIALYHTRSKVAAKCDSTPRNPSHKHISPRPTHALCYSLQRPHLQPHLRLPPLSAHRRVINSREIPHDLLLLLRQLERERRQKRREDDLWKQVHVKAGPVSATVHVAGTVNSDVLVSTCENMNPLLSSIA